VTENTGKPETLGWRTENDATCLLGQTSAVRLDQGVMEKMLLLLERSALLPWQEFCVLV